MHITRHTLNKAVQANILTSSQAEALHDFIQQLPGEAPAYNATNVLYYFGGLLAICAMTLFMTLGWETFGGFGIFFLAILYGMLGLSMATWFQSKHHSTPTAICATFVTCLTPLAIYGLQVGMGWWPEHAAYRLFHAVIQWHWVFMEFGTLIMGVILAWIYPYPFLVMPIAVTLWYMSMDFTSMLTGGVFDFELSATVTLYFGFIMLLIAFWVDVRSRHGADFAFWLYLFGVLTFWCGLSAHYSDNELSKLIYCGLNLILITLGVLLMRRVFVVFGGIGVMGYLGHLSWSLFKDSLLFPMVLTFIGFIIIYLGMLWQKHEKHLTQRLRAILPKTFQELLDARE